MYHTWVLREVPLCDFFLGVCMHDGNWTLWILSLREQLAPVIAQETPSLDASPSVSDLLLGNCRAALNLGEGRVVTIVLACHLTYTLPKQLGSCMLTNFRDLLRIP